MDIFADHWMFWRKIFVKFSYSYLWIVYINYIFGCYAMNSHILTIAKQVAYLVYYVNGRQQVNVYIRSSN